MTRTDFARRTRALGCTGKYVAMAERVLVPPEESINGVARAHGADPGYLSRLCRRIREAEICESCGQVKS